MSRKKQVNQKITALYCRISLEDGGDNESMSISNQKLMLRDFAEKNGMFQYEYYVDDGYTGRNFNRPSFQRMIADIEAAQLDGCGYISFFFKICLPLSKAIIAVIALWAAVGQWNGYFNALIYLRSEALQPLQIVLRNILISNQTISSMMTGSAAVEAKQMADLIKYAVIVVSSAPIMCMYPFVQKYFNQGVMLGAVKG